MTKLPHAPAALEAAAATSAVRERLFAGVAGVALVGVGAAFWAVNGTGTFTALMSAAFSWCF